MPGRATPAEPTSSSAGRSSRSCTHIRLRGSGPWSARARLRREPGAAALFPMTLAAMAGIAGFIAGTVPRGHHPVAMLGAVSVGVPAFVHTFGLVFALAIPLGSGVWIWSITRRKEEIARRAWWVLTITAAPGWIVVGVAGAAVSGA